MKENNICATSTGAEQRWSNIVKSRRSTRKFLKTNIPMADIELIIEQARLCPSGGNMQPWRVHILKTITINRVASAINADIASYGFSKAGDYQYYPSTPIGPYAERIRQSGKDVHDALNIGSREIDRIKKQKLENFNFFGAPIGLILTIDRRLGSGSWIDIGIFIGYLLTAIKSCGLDSCVQASFSSYGNIIRNTLDLDAEDLIVCGIAIGKADSNAEINNLPLRRAEKEEFVTCHP